METGKDKFVFDKDRKVPPIRQIREALGKTQVQMAEALDMKIYTYERWERGLHKPKPDSVMPLIKRLGLLCRDIQLTIYDFPYDLI